MFLRNGWYSALWRHELADKPVAKTFLGEKVVLFRTAGGKAGALEDCCCHRAAPLSLGEVAGETLACGYHGLKFDVHGKCVAVPGQAEVPSGAKVRSYPVAEKWNVVWIWMGDPAQADPAKIPDMPWLSDPKWTTTPGRLHVNSNYQFIVDNLLDLTHVSYVHKNTLAGDPREATTPTKTERLNDGVRVGRWMLDFAPPPLFAKAGNFTGTVDRWQFATWHPPIDGLSRRRLRQGRHRRAAGRPQPGHLDLVEPPGHAGDRAFEPLPVLFRARLRPGRRADVEDAVRGLQGDLHGGRGIPRGGAGQPHWRLARRPHSHHRRCRAASGAAHAHRPDRRRAGVRPGRISQQPGPPSVASGFGWPNPPASVTLGE